MESLIYTKTNCEASVIVDYVGNTIAHFKALMNIKIGSRRRFKTESSSVANNTFDKDKSERDSYVIARVESCQARRFHQNHTKCTHYLMFHLNAYKIFEVEFSTPFLCPGSIYVIRNRDIQPRNL